MFYYVKEMMQLISKPMSLMKVLVFLDLFFYMEYMMCIYRLGMYAAHELYIRPPYAVDSRWSPRVRGVYAVHTPLAPWIDTQYMIRFSNATSYAVAIQGRV